MRINDVVENWDYPLSELLNYLNLTYDEYIQLKTINAPLDKRTINLIQAIKIIYSLNKRVRFLRLCNL